VVESVTAWLRRVRFIRDLGSPTVVLLGLALAARVSLVGLIVPQVHTAWFIPFFENVANHPSWDPWQSFLNAGGDQEAFPFGPMMLAFFGLCALATGWLPEPWGMQLGLGIGILLLELALWALVYRWRAVDSHFAMLLIAWSPVALYAGYLHGQLDMLPALLMFAAAVMLRHRRWWAAGLLSGLAVGSTLPAAFVPPLVVIFLLRNARFRDRAREYLIGLTPGLLLGLLPLLLPGYRSMAFETLARQSVLSYALELGPGLTIVVLPVVYVALCGLIYSFKRGNPDLLVLIIGMTLTAVPLLTPASPGWYLWAVPFLAVLAPHEGRQVVAATWLFSSFAAAMLSVRASGANWRPKAEVFEPTDRPPVGAFVDDLDRPGAMLATGTVVVGVLLLVAIFLRARRHLDMYRLSSSPMSVTIAGDSGTGKDTLCISLANVFGESATSLLMGDDYHLYDRKAPLWQVTTHLHPAANDLATMNQDALSLMRGRPVRAVHYDHARGRFTKKRFISQRELVVINGLHALTSVEVRRTADLTVFMSMDEPLRRQLKINRDVGERGHALASVVGSIERRYPHTRRFIDPQAKLADVVLRLQPTSPLPADEAVRPGRVDMVLVARLRSASFAQRLQRALISVGNCSAWTEHLEVPGAVQLVVHPEALTPADTAAIAQLLVERPEELFTEKPVWLGQSRGVMQLIVVLALLERRKGGRER
jgi:uridine kinase